MTLNDFIGGISGFRGKTGPQKLEILGWFLHEVVGCERFDAADLTTRFDEAHEPRLSNIHRDLASLVDRKRFLKDGGGYRLAATPRAELSAVFAIRPSAVKTTAILDGLAGRIADPAQKTFLAETLGCFKAHAYRAAIVMAWNLAYSDILDRIAKNHRAVFNAQRARNFPKLKEVTVRSDFEDYKESTVLEIARGAGILSSSSFKVLDEKLGKRNSAAHPSSMIISPVTAEEVISDLVQNIILRPNL